MVAQMHLILRLLWAFHFAKWMQKNERSEGCPLTREGEKIMIIRWKKKQDDLRYFVPMITLVPTDKGVWMGHEGK